MINVEDIYAQNLVNQQEINREKYNKFDGFFSASSAGSCFKKQLLRKAKVKEPPMDDRVMRLLRLGTIVHEDIQKSITQYMNDENSSYMKQSANDMEIVMEHMIQMPELNLIGHLDIGIASQKSNTAKVIDIKTCASYKWRMKFGRKPDKKGNPNYNMQVATYGMAFANEKNIDNFEMSLLWYNKDTSAMREEYVGNEWVNKAIEYWEELNDHTEDESYESLEVGSYGVPMENWECRYCGFKDIHCKGVN
tara:strand:+ start:423 stop:1172 length:750 start_codon:yes stop_codon:yes gene_type:complete